MAWRCSLVSWMSMMSAVDASDSMSVIMWCWRVRPASSTASAESEVTLYVAMVGDGMMEVRGLIVDGLGCEKLVSCCLWRLMMRARFLVRVVVIRRVVRVGGGLVLVGGVVGAGGRPVRSTISSSLLSPSLMVMRLRRRVRGRGGEWSLSFVRSSESEEVMIGDWFAVCRRTCMRCAWWWWWW